MILTRGAAETSTVCSRLYYGLLTALPKSEEAELDGQGDREEVAGNRTNHDNVDKANRGNRGHHLERSQDHGEPGTGEVTKEQGTQGTVMNSKKTKIDRQQRGEQ